MPGRRAAWRARALAACIAWLAAGGATAMPVPGCVVVLAHPGGERLGAWPLASGEPALRLRYRHSVTMSTVEERYDVSGSTLVQTQIRFSEHGPGLPTQAEAGQAWTRENGEFVLHLARPLEAIVGRVDAAQAPTLTLGTTTIDLAQWGRRAIRLAVHRGACVPP